MSAQASGVFGVGVELPPDSTDPSRQVVTSVGSSLSASLGPSARPSPRGSSPAGAAARPGLGLEGGVHPGPRRGSGGPTADGAATRDARTGAGADGAETDGPERSPHDGSSRPRPPTGAEGANRHNAQITLNGARRENGRISAPPGRRLPRSAGGRGSAPGRVQVMAAARTASSASSARVAASIARRSTRRAPPSRSRRCRPASRAAMQASPAPTVSTTSTARPGRRSTPAWRVAASSPAGPRVITTIAGPGQPGLGDLLGGPAGEQPVQVVGAGLDHVGQGDQGLDAAADGVGGAHQQGPAVGVVGDGHGPAGPGQQPLEHVGPGRHGQGERPGVQGHDPAVEGAGELVVAPLPVGRALDPEVVLDHPSRPTATMASEVGSAARTAYDRSTPLPSRWALPVPEQVVGDPGQQPGRHLPGQPHGHGLPPGAARNTPARRRARSPPAPPRPPPPPRPRPAARSPIRLLLLAVRPFSPTPAVRTGRLRPPARTRTGSAPAGGTGTWPRAGP